MEIQGTEEQIDSVILAIEAGRYVRIENMDSKTIPLVENEHEPSYKVNILHPLTFIIPQHRGFDTSSYLHPHPINEGVKRGEA